MTKLRTKQGFQRVAIILPLSKIHHTELRGVSVNALAVNDANYDREVTHVFRNLFTIAWKVSH